MTCSSDNWPTTEFDELVEFYDHHRIPLSKRERRQRKGPYPYYGAQGVIDSLDDYIFDGRYLLIAEDGENLNSRKLPVAFIAEGQFWVNNHAHVVKARPGVADDDFLRAYVEFHPLNGLITGAAQPKLSQSNLKKLQVKTPPYGTQVKIGNVIRDLDGAIENNRRRIEILEEMTRLIYREWFVHFRYPGHEDTAFVDSQLGSVPQAWEVVPVGQVCDVLGGGTPSRKVEEYWEDGSIPWYTPSDLTKNPAMFAVESAERVTPLGLARSSAKIFPAGSVMMTSRATIGALAIATTDSCTNQGFIVCVPSDVLSNYHLYFWLEDNVELFLGLAGGATFKELRRSMFRDLPIILPPQGVEEGFVERVGPMCELIATLIQQNRVLQEARDLLLPRFVSGELDVSELDVDLVSVG